MSGAAADLDLDACLSVALGAAREAGEVIVAAFNEVKRVEVKGNLADLVTDTDKQCEELINRRLTEAFLDDGFGLIGEEQTAAAAHGLALRGAGGGEGGEGRRGGGGAGGAPGALRRRPPAALGEPAVQGGE